MERWFKLEFREIPRTWTKKQWKEVCHFQRTIAREMHSVINFGEFTFTAVNKAIDDIPANLTLEQLDRIQKLLDIYAE
jgi:hypothetical protein